MTTLRRSLPLLIPLFLNKTCSMGLAVVPMLLVVRGLNADQSALVMFLVKGAILLGTFVGSLTAERVGLRQTVLASFFLAGIGMLALPSGNDVIWLGIFAVLAQFSQSLFVGSSRLLLSELVPQASFREAVGWMRTFNNLGQIVGYVASAVFAAMGTAFFLMMDGIASLVAGVIGALIIPAVKHVNPQPGEMKPEDEANWKLLRDCALALGGFTYMFEVFLVAAPARYAVLYPENALRIFSLVMIINTVICTVLAVPMTRWIRSPRIALVLGLALTGVGALMGSAYADSLLVVFAGALILTVGENIFTSIGPVLLIRASGEAKGRGTVLGTGLLIQNCGRIVGGSVAFPFVVHGNYPKLFIWISIAITLVLGVRAVRAIERAGLRF